MEDSVARASDVENPGAIDESNSVPQHNVAVWRGAPADRQGQGRARDEAPAVKAC